MVGVAVGVVVGVVVGVGVVVAVAVVVVVAVVVAVVAVVAVVVGVGVGGDMTDPRTLADRLEAALPLIGAAGHHVLLSLCHDAAALLRDLADERVDRIADAVDDIK